MKLIKIIFRAELYNKHNPPKKIDMFAMYVIEFVNRKDSPLFHLEVSNGYAKV